MSIADGDDPSDVDEYAVIEPSETTNLCAVVALFSALVGLFLPAIVLGVIGFIEVGRRENERGDGIAGVAVFLGVLEIVIVGVLLWRLQVIQLGDTSA
ncbi:hypothetical protein AB4Z55_27405 [Gordonia sp. ABKF26]|uniref:hypothetical protein n=1 Tax=Gordonia sp. ABKF26 TaxID=3238687 RepID=UPI0034E38128